MVKPDQRVSHFRTQDLADSQPTTLPDELRGEHELAVVNNIDLPADRARDADLSPESIAKLADAIARDGLMQPIGVRRTGLRYKLIWGRRRLEAYRSHADRLGRYIHAVVYPYELPSAWARVLEIDENEKRQDLTIDERAAHAIELAAAIKMIEESASQESLTKSDLTGETKPTTGRGHKGIVQKVAERQKVDQAAVRKRAQKVAEAIGEPIDLQADPPAELERKAAKFKAAVKTSGGRRRTPKAPKVEPARETGTFTIGQFTHRFEVPQKNATKLDTAWLMHAPAEDVAKWWKSRGDGEVRLRAILDALATPAKPKTRSRGDRWLAAAAEAVTPSRS